VKVESMGIVPEGQVPTVMEWRRH